MSLSSDLKVVSAVKTVAAAGTREPLAVGDLNLLRVRSVTIRALTGNGGNVFIGNGTVSNAVYYALSPGETITYQVSWEGWQRGEAINLNSLWLDVAVNGEGVCYTALRD